MEPQVVDQKKSKKKIVWILIVTAVLALASIGTAYYYFQIKDLSPQDSNASQGCACYFVKATDTVTSCTNADPKDAFEFRTGTIQSDGTCSASCDLRTAASLSTTSGQTPTILACKMSQFQSEYGCVDISVSQETDKRVAGEVNPDKDATVVAKFTPSPNLSAAETEFYNGFSFTINGVKSDFQLAQAKTTGTGATKTYEISTIVKDFSTADKLTIQAFGKTTSGGDITSQACLRTLTVSRPKAPTCTDIDAEVIRTSSGNGRVNEVSLTTASVSSPTSLSIKFTIGSTQQTLTTKNIASLFASNTLVLNQTYLYTSSNFIDGKSFALLNTQTNSIPIKAEVYVNGTKIDSGACTGTYDIPKAPETEGRDPTDGPGTNTDTDSDTDTDDRDPDQQAGDTSNFSVAKAASRVCVERISPSNTVRYTITVRNNDTDTDNVVRIEDKLPYGFRYQNGSTYINGSIVSDAGYVSTTQVGSSQKITFARTGGWNLTSTQAMTIRFTATVLSTALSGSNLNEVVVIPENTPRNSTSVRTSTSVTVAQSCTSPETGIFDSTLSKVILGCIIIVLGLFLYYSQSGFAFTSKLLAWGPIRSTRKAANMLKLKTSNPRKYFEEKFIQKIDKEKPN